MTDKPRWSDFSKHSTDFHQILDYGKLRAFWFCMILNWSQKLKFLLNEICQEHLLWQQSSVYEIRKDNLLQVLVGPFALHCNRIQMLAKSQGDLFRAKILWKRESQNDYQQEDCKGLESYYSNCVHYNKSSCKRSLEDCCFYPWWFCQDFSSGRGAGRPRRSL